MSNKCDLPMRIKGISLRSKSKIKMIAISYLWSATQERVVKYFYSKENYHGRSC